MKSALGWVLAGVLATALVVGWLWHDHQADGWATDKTRILAQSDLKSAAAAAATQRADSLQRVATLATRDGDRARARGDSLADVADSLKSREDSLERALPTVTPPACQIFADALAACKARGDALALSLAAVDSADNAHQAALANATAALSETRLALGLVTSDRDSLRALVRRAPGTCRIPLLGLRCPVLGAGYGAFLDGSGHVSGGPFAGGMIPLVGGR